MRPGKDPKKRDMPNEPLASPVAKWNSDGRRYTAELNALIADSYEGRPTPKDWPKDPRTIDQARSILATVEAEARDGRWQETPIADRAYSPFGGMLEEVGQCVRCVCVLGHDEFLVLLGTIYQSGQALHLRGAQIIERPDILAAAMTRSHDLLLLVRKEGFSVCRSLDDEPIAHFPWPDGVRPRPLDILQISEDGRTVAFVEPENAVWLGQVSDADVVWTRVYPNAAFLAEQHARDGEDDDDSDWSDSMMHCGLSPDGQFIAYGSQCYGHFVDRVVGIGAISRFAEIGYRSEYPHYACFSDDSAYAALNSCHFYHGATVGIRVADCEGAHTPPYREDERVKLIDDRLRVYAGTWLPLGNDRDGFALGGAGYLDIVSVEGSARNTIFFGASASSIDYCPKTGVLALGSYAGFLHLYDPTRAADEGTAIGYRPLHERYRWVLWRDRPPFRW